MNIREVAALCLSVLVTALVSIDGRAQNYPARPIRIIVPFTPGGSTDLYARTLGPKLADALGQQVVVDNRAGAGGALGAELAAIATPDGYTIWIGQTANLAIGPALRKKSAYDPIRDFAPITLVQKASSVIVVSASSPITSLKDLIAAAKKNPQGITYGSAGVGTAGHINGYLINLAAGIDMTHVPYKGASPAMLDLQGGRITLLATSIGSSAGLIKQGKIRAISTTGTKRARLTMEGRIALCASEKFLKRNQNKTFEEQVAYNHRALDMFKEHDIPVKKGSIMVAFGCNFEGDVDAARVVLMVDQIFAIAAERDVSIEIVSLADTMAWATPATIKRTVGAVRERYPELRLNLHLHDTRGMAIANAYAGLEMGVDMFDSSVAGLGGCPFAGHKGAAGNICTEDLVFMCEEMNISTGVDLERLVACARLAEDVVGHLLPGSVKLGGTLDKLRESVH